MRIDLRYLLNFRERAVLKGLEKYYRDRFHREPESDRDLVIHLGDSYERRNWSAVSGKIPTMRHGGGVLWSPARRRPMIPKERLAALGFPVTRTVAHCLGFSSALPVQDVRRAAAVAGNAMHWGNVAIVQLVALCSFKLET